MIFTHNCSAVLCVVKLKCKFKHNSVPTYRASHSLKPAAVRLSGPQQGDDGAAFIKWKATRYAGINSCVCWHRCWTNTALLSCRNVFAAVTASSEEAITHHSVSCLCNAYVCVSVCCLCGHALFAWPLKDTGCRDVGGVCAPHSNIFIIKIKIKIIQLL